MTAKELSDETRQSMCRFMLAVTMSRAATMLVEKYPEPGSMPEDKLGPFPAFIKENAELCAEILSLLYQAFTAAEIMDLSGITGVGKVR